MPTGSPVFAPALVSVRFRWPEICDARGPLPDDVLRYVEGWCAHDRAGLLPALARARTSSVPGLASAALHDAAAVLAEADVAPDAVAQLNRFAGVSVVALELLVNAYLDRGRDDQARRVIRDAPVSLPRVTCRIAVSDLLATFDVQTPRALDALHATCRSQVDAIFDRPELPDAQIARLYQAWPHVETAAAWLDLAERAIAARAARIAATALDNALDRDCTMATLARATSLANTLLAWPDRDLALDDALHAIVRIEVEACTRR